MEDSPTTTDLGSGEAPVPGPTSLADLVAQKRQELADDVQKDFPIPGYKGLLQARYNLMDSQWAGDVANRVFKSTNKDDDRALLVAIDQLIGACDSIRIVNPETEEDVTDQELPGNTGYSTEIAEYAKLQGVNSAREVVMALFGNRSMAIISHCQEVLAWMGSSSRAFIEELMGEV